MLDKSIWISFSLSLLVVTASAQTQPDHVTWDEAIEKINKERFIQVLQNETVEVFLYAPKDMDHQKPHRREEIYFIVTGEAKFFDGQKIIKVQHGDMVRVKAHQEHRFEEFSDDFSTWVVFYGPEL